MPNRDYDVIVVGSGAAGLSAAVAAADNGASVLIVEAEQEVGGSSRLSGGHFYAAAAEAMRRILVENARRKQSLQHGGGFQRIELPDIDLPIQGDANEILVLDEALAKLSVENKSIADIVQLYYFAGLTLDQVALAQGISRPTAAKRLAYGRAWLHRQLRR